MYPRSAASAARTGKVGWFIESTHGRIAVSIHKSEHTYSGEASVASSLNIRRSLRIRNNSIAISSYDASRMAARVRTAISAVCINRYLFLRNISRIQRFARFRSTAFPVDRAEITAKRLNRPVQYRVCTVKYRPRVPAVRMSETISDRFLNRSVGRSRSSNRSLLSLRCVFEMPCNARPENDESTRLDLLVLCFSFYGASFGEKK